MRKGNDITIISYSRGLETAIETGKILAQENIDAEVLNLRTLKPIDKETIINSVKKTNKVVIIEEGWSQSGVASEVISIIVENVFDYLDTEPLRFSGKDIPLPYAENLEKLALPSVDSIVKKCLEIC